MTSLFPRTLMCAEKILLAVVLLLVVPLSAQENSFYDVQLLNKGFLYTSASILQDYDDDGDLDIIIARYPKAGLPAAVEWLENDGTGQFPRHELFRDLVYRWIFKPVTSTTTAEWIT